MNDLFHLKEVKMNQTQNFFHKKKLLIFQPSLFCTFFIQISFHSDTCAGCWRIKKFCTLAFDEDFQESAFYALCCTSNTRPLYTYCINISRSVKAYFVFDFSHPKLFNLTQSNFFLHSQVRRFFFKEFICQFIKRKITFQIQLIKIAI